MINKSIAWCLFVLIFCAGEVLAETRIALVIGNGNYNASPLSNPVNDAKLVAATLEKLNFKVTMQVNVDQKTFKRLIRDFGKLLKHNRDAIGLFYYSGHGMQVEGRNYMIPVGANILDETDVSIDGVSVDDVLTRMKVAHNTMNFIILDACRDNPFEKSFKSESQGLGRMDAPKGSLIAFAAEPHRVALQGSGKYSIFTEALAQKIMEKGLPVEQVFKNVRIVVDQKTNGKQLPVTENRLLGNFVFNQGVTRLALPTVTKRKKPPSAFTWRIPVAPEKKAKESLSSKWLQTEPKKETTKPLSLDWVKRAQDLKAKESPSSRWLQTEPDKKTSGLSSLKRPSLTLEKQIPFISQQRVQVGKFIKIGLSVILDTSTNLMWAAYDNGADISWYAAQEYARNYTAGGYTDWRVPTLRELQTVCNTSRVRDTIFKNKLITTTGRLEWTSESSENKYSNGVACHLDIGDRWAYPKTSSSNMRVLPVRNAK